MLKSNKKNLVLNSSVMLHEHIEAEGKGRKFVSRFIEAGVAHYQEFGDILITKETLDKFVHTMVGCPVIINHKDITDKNADDERVGVVSNVWYNECDGWYYCDGIIWNKQAIDLVKNQNWNVSCTYDFESDFIEKTHNGKKIDMEFTNGKFLHLALVNNPRYERANIVMNGKDKVENDRWITVHPNGEDEKGRPLLIKDGETPKEAMQRQWGLDDGQQTLDFKGAKKAVKDAKIYQNKKEASKDKLYKAITDYWEDRTDANEKKFDEAEKEYEKYHDEKIKDYDEFIYDYEEKDEEKRAGQRYKEYVNKLKSDTKDKKSETPKGKVTAKDIGLEKTFDDGIKETQDSYGRTIFSKGNKWANVSSNGGRKDSWFASYGLTHKSPVSWEKEKGVIEEQLLNARYFKTEKGARKWALEQLKRITAQNDINNIVSNALVEVIAENCLGE